MKIAVFRWRDACAMDEWSELSGKQPSTLDADVCGFLIGKTRAHITVGLERFTTGEWRNVLTVPRVLILKSSYREFAESEEE